MKHTWTPGELGGIEVTFEPYSWQALGATHHKVHLEVWSSRDVGIRTTLHRGNLLGLRVAIDEAIADLDAMAEAAKR